MNRSILAVVGLPGAGKTEATKYVMGKTGWPKVYFGTATFDELKNRGLEVNEGNERKIREELRAKHGMAAFAILSLPKIRGLYKNSNVILESLYSWDEYETVKKEFGDAFRVLAIYASPGVRQKRMAIRKERPLTAEEFQSRDFAQIVNLHQAGPIARADYTVVNEGSLGELQGNIDKVLNELLTSTLSSSRRGRKGEEKFYESKN